MNGWFTNYYKDEKAKHRSFVDNLKDIPEWLNVKNGSFSITGNENKEYAIFLDTTSEKFCIKYSLYIGTMLKYQNDAYITIHLQDGHVACYDYSDGNIDFDEYKKIVLNILNRIGLLNLDPLGIYVSKREHGINPGDKDKRLGSGGGREIPINDREL